MIYLPLQLIRIQCYILKIETLSAHHFGYRHHSNVLFITFFSLRRRLKFYAKGIWHSFKVDQGFPYFYLTLYVYLIKGVESTTHFELRTQSVYQKTLVLETVLIYCNRCSFLDLLDHRKSTKIKIFITTYTESARSYYQIGSI